MLEQAACAGTGGRALHCTYLVYSVYSRACTLSDVHLAKVPALLYCNTLHCTALVLVCTYCVVHGISLHCTALYCTVLYCICICIHLYICTCVSQQHKYVALCNVTSGHTALHCNALA